MKINVKEINSLPRDKRIKYLRETEKTLINIKKSSDDEADIISAPYQIISKVNSKAIKEPGYISPENDSIHVKVVANTSYWIDSQMDMIIPGAVSKSINERKGLIPFLNSHNRTLDARIADVTDIYEEEINLKTLGIDKEGSTVALIFEGDVKKDYNKNIYTQYKNGQINQHSIGLRYVILELALDDPEDEMHYKNWVEFISKAINPELAIEMGYFWIVKEYKLIENSAVLFGANEITPTLETRSEDILSQNGAGEPPQKTIEPSKDTLQLINNFKL